ncbi:MAG: DUF4125 family protein [Lachnospiraceae bacterium]|nr:DUF4125 family protein [Lachnospiraceae bacterium]
MSEVSAREQLIFAIAEAEWDMFQNVRNTGGRASCQNDSDTFFKMRMSQWMVYPDEILESYFKDCQEAVEKGWNLIFEKYARMMENVYQEEYERLLPWIPQVSDKKKEMVEEMVQMHLEWDRWMLENYPNIRKNGRVMTTDQDSQLEGSSSESYLRAEALTYSERTVALLHAFCKDAWEKGENLLKQIIENETRFYGYESLEAAEAAHA